MNRRRVVIADRVRSGVCYAAVMRVMVRTDPDFVGTGTLIGGGANVLPREIGISWSPHGAAGAGVSTRQSARAEARRA